MVTVTSRQAGIRPETIRTRLARFMPKGPATGWSIAWSAQTERPEEIANEDQLRAAEHLGCYGAAVAHALAQAEVAAVRLRVTAEALPATGDGAPQPIAVEVHAQIPGGALDQTILETIVRRAEPYCSAWRKLASEAGIQVVVVLDESAATDAAESQADSAVTARTPAATSPATRPLTRGLRMPALLPAGVPSWLTPRFAGLVAVSLGALVVAHPWTMF
jgi:organic hydroperoxide reductase OsmC/OhrA